ncbi:unnamed protein product [Merluccius merluccius]
MGAVLSLSPSARKAAGAAAEEKLAGKKPAKGNLKKRHSALLHALTWKRLVAAKKKGAKKVNPNPRGSTRSAEPLTEHRNADSLARPGPKPAPLAVPVPTIPERSLLSPRKVVVQASTGELLRCLSDFLCRRCSKLHQLSSSEVITWFRNVDRTLLVQGWQDQGFITPANLVFVYLLCREAVDSDISSESELQASVLSCLYLSYSYLGNEISYPVKPFLVEASRDAFWQRGLSLISTMSSDMLRINADPHFFTQVFQDLKSQGAARERDKEREDNHLEHRETLLHELMNSRMTS